MKRLKELRINKGLSQKQLANVFHASQNTISQWENGTRKPSYDVTQEVASFFGVSVDYLLGRDIDIDEKKEVKKSNYEPMEIDFDPLQDIDSSNRVVIMHKGMKAGQDVIELSKEDFEDVMKIWDMIKKTRNGENES